MLKNIFFIVCILAFNAKFTCAQQVDTALILKHLKIRLLPELQLGLLSSSALDDYLERELKATTLKSRGFKDMVFFKISSQVFAVDTIKENKTIATYSTPVCLKGGEECYFVYGFNKRNGNFYRLRGAKENDFGELYTNMEQWEYWKHESKMNESTIKKFTTEFWVEGLDLGCLLGSLSGEKGTCLDYFSPDLTTD